MRLIYPVIFCSLLLTTAQVVWKQGLIRIGGFQPSLHNYHASLLALCMSPYIMIGVVLYIVATVVWLRILSHTPLSLAYPLMSLSYIMGVLAGWVVFKESVPVTRWLGVVVICGGICLMARK